MSATATGRVRCCGVCLRVARALIEDSTVFGSRIAQGKAGESGMRICDDHLPLVVGVTAPAQLAAWLLDAINAEVRSNRTCYLCETATLAEADALKETVFRGVACPKHGPADAAEAVRMKDLLVRIAAGERLLYSEELAALRAALIVYASIRGNQAHVLKLE